MMQHWRTWYDRLHHLAQAYPFILVEGAMSGLAIGLLGVWWIIDWISHATQSWPYLSLSVSYLTGAVASILVRQIVFTPTSVHRGQLLLLAISQLLLLTAVVSYSLTFPVTPEA